jgi:uncharacterized protein YggE
MSARSSRGTHMPFLRQALTIAILLPAAVLVPLKPVVAADGDKTAERLVHVSASGSIIMIPDIAHFSAGVTTDGDTPREALSRNKGKMAKLIDGLKAAGIAANDIQTSAFNLRSLYTPGKDGRASIVSGYTVSNQVRVTVRDLSRLGDILDQAITLGATETHGIAFAVSTAEALKDDARKLAVENCRRRAELYAAAVGGQLGPVLRVSEGGLFDDTLLFSFDKFSGRSSVPVEIGTQTLTVSVQVTYALR